MNLARSIAVTAMLVVGDWSGRLRPIAILSPPRSFTTRSSIDSPHVLITMACPLDTSPLPGPVMTVVTPPFTAPFQNASSGDSTSRIRCCGPNRIGNSLRSRLSAPMWEWLSSMPGMMTMPLRSTTSASPGGGSSAPSAVITPS